MVERAVGELAFYYGDKPNYGTGYDNGIWMDVLQVPWITKIEEASLYKIIIRTLWLEATGWSRTIRERYPHVIQIGLSDHPLSSHISRLSADRQYAYLKDLEYLDGILALTDEERQWYQTAIPSKPVERVGLPFPFESFEKSFGSFRDSEKEYIGLGVGASDNDRNFVSSILAFQRLQLKHPDLKGVFLSVPENLIPYCAYWADRVENIFIHQRVDLADYYKVLSQCKFVINLADRNTPGRLQGEAAFFKVPVIGSNRLELQNELFAPLAVQPFAIERVVELSEQLLFSQKNKMVEHYGEEAFDKLHNYAYDKSRERFNNLLTRAKGE